MCVKSFLFKKICVQLNLPPSKAFKKICQAFPVGYEFLTLSKVRVNAHVACRPSETLVLPVRDVFFGLGVDVLFGQTKVNDVDGVLPLASWPPNQEVLWFHISVYQTLSMDVLHPRYLAAKQKDQICIYPKVFFYKTAMVFVKCARFGFIFHCSALTSCMAIMRTVLRVKVRSQRSNRSSRLGPSSSITMALYFPQGPK